MNKFNKSRRKKGRKQVTANENMKIVFYKPNSDKPLTEATIDYKNVALLRKFMNKKSHILSRRVTGLNAKQQRKMAIAIKIARYAGFLPFIKK